MKLKIFFCSLILSVLTGCFTGVENTGRISEKDVSRVKADKKLKEELFLESILPEPFLQWRPGKQFYVTDDNIKLIFNPSNDYNLETISMKGSTLQYKGYKYEKEIDNTEVVVLSFLHNNDVFKYNTGKTIDDLSKLNPENIVPFVIDLDYVQLMDSLLTGKDLYIKTSLWMNEDLRYINGLHYVPVRITSVTVGNEVYPFLANFEHNCKRACVFMSSQASSMKNMTFDKLFSFSDIRQNYPSIKDDNWNRITKGQVALNMTKEECSLSLGVPRTIDRNPTHGGLYERWTYDNGVYLIFEDGLLIKYRN